jgi:hypothetical protein
MEPVHMHREQLISPDRSTFADTVIVVFVG